MKPASVTPYERASEILSRLGVKHDLVTIQSGQALLVDRTSMVNVFRDIDEHGSYQQALEILKAAFKEFHVMWSGRTDDWLGVEFLTRTDRAAQGSKP